MRNLFQYKYNFPEVIWVQLSLENYDVIKFNGRFKIKIKTIEKLIKRKCKRILQENKIDKWELNNHPFLPSPNFILYRVQVHFFKSFIGL